MAIASSERAEKPELLLSHLVHSEIFGVQDMESELQLYQYGTELVSVVGC